MLICVSAKIVQLITGLSVCTVFLCRDVPPMLKLTTKDADGKIKSIEMIQGL